MFDIHRPKIDAQSLDILGPKIDDEIGYLVLTFMDLKFLIISDIYVPKIDARLDIHGPQIGGEIWLLSFYIYGHKLIPSHDIHGPKIDVGLDINGPEKLMLLH